MRRTYKGVIMNKVKNTIKIGAKNIKKYVDDHRYAVMAGLAVTTVAAVALQQTNVKAFYAFLEEKGIDPMEYYSPEAFETLNA